MEIEVVTSQADFAGLREEWNELLTRSATKHIFLMHEWQYTWWEHFGTGDRDLLILLVRDEGRLVGIAPLRRDVLRVRGVPLLRVLSFLVGSEADYRDLLLDHQQRWATLDTILTHLMGEVSGWQALLLNGVRGDSATNYLAPCIAARHHLGICSSAGAVCPYINLTGSDPDGWDLARGQGTVKEYDRKRRKARREAMADTVFHRGAACLQALDEFFRLHDCAWAARGGSRAITQEGTKEFHRMLVERLEPDGHVLLALLSLDGHIASARYGYTYKEVSYEYLTGYDPQFRSLSPGALITLDMLDHLQAVGVREVDFMRGDEPYKFNFAQTARTTMAHAIYRSQRIRRLHQVLEALAVARV